MKISFTLGVPILAARMPVYSGGANFEIPCKFRHPTGALYKRGFNSCPLFQCEMCQIFLDLVVRLAAGSLPNCLNIPVYRQFTVTLSSDILLIS